MEVVIDRIESKRIDRMRKIILFCGIASVLLLGLKFVSKTSFSFDNIVILSLSAFLCRKLWVELNVRTGQFIEWTKDNVIYKLRTENPQTIAVSEIKDIHFGAQTFEILTNANEKYILDVSDFSNYNDRKRVRENFEKLKTILVKN